MVYACEQRNLGEISAFICKTDDFFLYAYKKNGSRLCVSKITSYKLVACD